MNNLSTYALNEVNNNSIINEKLSEEFNSF